MKARILFATLAFSTLFATAGGAATPEPAAVQTYIGRTWNALTRSLHECRALVGVAAESHPVIYLPWHVPAPASLLQSAARCKVQVRDLPAPITRLGELDPRTLTTQGPLYLPYPYVVPGGSFNAMYGWDSYFIVLGLLADHDAQLALDMVNDQLYEVQYYGGVLNANRTYYLSRSQPPLLSAMMVAVMGDPHGFASAGAEKAWLAHAYPLAVKNYEIWTHAPHLAGDTGLSRYSDFDRGPAIELSNSDGKYYVGVIQWLLAHPSEDPGYLVKGSRNPNAAEARALAKTSCNVAVTLCRDAWFGGYRLSAGYYAGDRAMRESGFDTDFHFGPFGGSTVDYAGTGLNSLLYRYARDLQQFATDLGRPAAARRWADAAEARRRSIDKYLWQPGEGRYMDYDFVTGKASTDPYLTMFYPLWAKVASRQQADRLQKQIRAFEHRGGLAMSTRITGAQWDAPYGWAPTNWLAVKGFENYGFDADARRIACEFTGTVDRSFARTGTIVEKYNMYLGNAKVDITAGYKQNMVGFGWTNGVYLKMMQLLDADGGCAAPAASAR